MNFVIRSLKKQKDLRKHLKSHSYIEARFKCVDCDFVGESNETMEVHVEKELTNTFECGICNFEAQSHEDICSHVKFISATSANVKKEA